MALAKYLSVTKLVTLAAVAQKAEARIKAIKADGEVEPKEVALAVAWLIGEVLDALGLLEVAEYIRHYVLLGYDRFNEGMDQAIEIEARVKGEVGDAIQIAKEVYSEFEKEAPEG